MTANNKISTVITIFLILVFFWKVVASRQITAVVAYDKGQKLAKTATIQGLKQFHSKQGNELVIRELELDEEDVRDKVCHKLYEERPYPTFMIDVTQTVKGTGSQIVKHLSREMGLPTISTTNGFNVELSKWRFLDDVERQLLLHVKSPQESIPTIVKTLAIQYKVKQAAIMFDDTFPLDTKADTLLQNVKARHIYRKLVGKTVEELKPLVEMTRNVLYKDNKYAKVYSYFLLGSIETINMVLDAAHSLDMFGKKYKWYLITRGKGKIKCPKCRDVKFIYAQPIKTRLFDYEHKAVVDKVDKGNRVDAYFYYDLARYAVDIIEEAMNETDWPESWSFPTCGIKMNETVLEQRKIVKFGEYLGSELLYGMYGRFAFDSFFQQSNWQEINMRIDQAAFNHYGSLKSSKTGEWEFEGNGGYILFTQLQEGSGGDGKRKWRIVTVEQAPFVIKTPEFNQTDLPDNRRWKGYCLDMLRRFQEYDPTFDFEIFESSDGKFGSFEDKDGTWNGMIKDLMDDKADIALGPISVMAERELVVEFTVPYYDLVGIQILMKKPVVVSHLFKFLTVLETNVWLCILAAYFFTSFLMWMFDRLSPYSYRNNKEKYKDDDEKREFTLKECLWFCMTSLTPQGGGEAPRNLSGRLVAATWWLFGFIIIASYTANLAAFLTVSRLDSTIESLDDLAKQYKIKYAPQAGTSSATYFERMANIEERFYEIWKDMSLNDNLTEKERAELAVWDYPVSDKYTKIWAQIQEANMPTTWAQGIEQVKKSEKSQEQFAFIAESTMVQYAIMTNCDLKSVGEEFSRKPLALAVRKLNASYVEAHPEAAKLKDDMNKWIIQMFNDRTLEHLKEQWWEYNEDNKHCIDFRKSSDGIAINNIGGVFIVIFIGIVVACIALVVEYWYFKGKKYRGPPGVGPGNSVQVKMYGNRQSVMPPPGQKLPIGIPQGMGPMALRR